MLFRPFFFFLLWSVSIGHFWLRTANVMLHSCSEQQSCRETNIAGQNVQQNKFRFYNWKLQFSLNHDHDGYTPSWRWCSPKIQRCGAIWYCVEWFERVSCHSVCVDVHIRAQCAFIARSAHGRTEKPHRSIRLRATKRNERNFIWLREMRHSAQHTRTHIHSTTSSISTQNHLVPRKIFKINERRIVVWRTILLILLNLWTLLGASQDAK